MARSVFGSLDSRGRGVNVRLGWLVILAFLIQMAAIIVIDDPSAATLKKAILGVSAMMLAIGLMANLHLWSFRALAAGFLLNAVVMIANGGLMPITPENVDRVYSQETAQILNVGDTPPKSKEVVLEPDDTRLDFLSDIIYMPVPNSAVYSVGDVLLLAGLVTFLIEASIKGVLRRKKSQSRLETSVNDGSQ